MKEILNKVIGSLDNSDNGSFSSRKLSALIIIVLVIISHVKWFKSDKWEYLAEVLLLDYTFILACLGLTTWQNVKTKQLENGAKD
jgi:hypothetical protein